MRSKDFWQRLKSNWQKMREELTRVIILTTSWLLYGALISISYHFHWISDATQVPEPITNFIHDQASVWSLLILIGPSLILAGLLMALRPLSRHVQEGWILLWIKEAAGIMYPFATFSAVGLLTLWFIGHDATGFAQGAYTEIFCIIVALAVGWYLGEVETKRRYVSAGAHPPDARDVIKEVRTTLDKLEQSIPSR